MDLTINKVLIAKFLVDYVGDYNYRCLDEKTILKIKNQDVFQLISSSPSDAEFLIASGRIADQCRDENYLSFYPYYELLCMYAQLGYFKKFFSVLHYLDSEVETLSEVVESNDAYYLPLYSYLVPNKTGGFLIYSDDDELIGRCDYPGGPILKESLQDSGIVKITVDSFDKVLDRFLDDNAERYFPERYCKSDSICDEEISRDELIREVSSSKEIQEVSYVNCFDQSDSSVVILSESDQSVSSSICDDVSIYEVNSEDSPDVELELVDVSNDCPKTYGLRSYITNASNSISLDFFASCDRVYSKMLELCQLFNSSENAISSWHLFDIHDPRLIKTIQRLRCLSVDVLCKYYIM